MIDLRGKANTFLKLDFENSHLVPEFRCYYDQNNDDYIISKASLFYLLQRLSPNTGISRQIAMQSQLASGQFEDLSKMVSLKELTKSSIFLSEDLERIKENLFPDQYSGFKVSQNGEIILTKKILLEALQQVSKSRDEKFFSEHFSYIAKDFDPSQPSQYSAQSFEEYKDWLVGLNKDRILQINIEQLKIDCQNGLAGEGINLQNFLAISKLSPNLLEDVNNYFRDNLFTTTNSMSQKPTNDIANKLKDKESEIFEKLKQLYSLEFNGIQLQKYEGCYDWQYGEFSRQQVFTGIKSGKNNEYRLYNGNVYHSSDQQNFKSLGTYEEFSMQLDQKILNSESHLAQPFLTTQKNQSKEIITLLGTLNSLRNPQSDSIRINYFGNQTMVYTQNSTFLLDENSKQIYQSKRESSIDRPIFSGQPMSYDNFEIQLRENIAQEQNKQSLAVSWHSSHHAQQPSYLPTHLYTQNYPNYPTIHGGADISYSSSDFYTPQGYINSQPINPYGQVYQAPFSTSALPYGVGGGAMAMGSYHQMLGQGYGGVSHMSQRFTTPQLMSHPQPMIHPVSYYQMPSQQNVQSQMYMNGSNRI